MISATVKMAGLIVRDCPNMGPFGQVEHDGSVGDALDNAAAESFLSTLQTELLDTRLWESKEELETAIFEYIEVFYNRQRRHSSVEYMTPMEFERKNERQRLAASA